MEHQNILSFLNEANNSKFVTWQWNIVNDNSKAKYGVGNEINCNTEVLKSMLYDYKDAYIFVRGDITVTAAPETLVVFKNCAWCTKCITKIDGTTLDDAEDLDLVMPMYNFIEYSSNYSETTGHLWLHSKDEATNFNANIENTDNFKSFKYNAKLLGNNGADSANGI